MYVYSLDPIDDWFGWMTLEKWREGVDIYEFHAGEMLLEVSQKLALKIGWEGDIREGVFVAPIPRWDAVGGMDYIFAWKQDNNGTTFIASPYRMRWLESNPDRWTTNNKTERMDS